MDNRLITISLLLISLFLISCSDHSSPLKLNEYIHTDNGAYAADLSLDGKYAVISSPQGIMAWQFNKNLPQYHWQHKNNEANQVIIIDIAADNSVVATADSQRIALWNLQTGHNKGFWQVNESPIEDVKVANQGKSMVVAQQNGIIEHYNLETGRRLRFLGHTERISDIAMSANGRYILSGDYQGKALLWDSKTGQITHQFPHTGRITKVALDDNGKFAFTANNFKQSYIWNVQTGEKISQLQYPMRQLIFSAVQFSRDGRIMATGAANKKIKLWQVSNGELIADWHFKADGFAASILDFAFIDGDKTLIAENSFGLAELWDISELSANLD